MRLEKVSYRLLFSAHQVRDAQQFCADLHSRQPRRRQINFQTHLAVSFGEINDPALVQKVVSFTHRQDGQRLYLGQDSGHISDEIEGKLRAKLAAKTIPLELAAADPEEDPEEVPAPPPKRKG